MRNLGDPQSGDDMIPGVYEDLLVDVVISVPDDTGTELSFEDANGWGIREEDGQDVLYLDFFGVLAGEAPEPVEIATFPYGTYITSLYIIDALVTAIDLAEVTTPYQDEYGDPAPVPIKSPIPLSMAHGENLLDTTPTFE